LVLIGGGVTVAGRFVYDFIKRPDTDLIDRRANCEKQRNLCDVKFTELGISMNTLSNQITNDHAENNERQRNIENQLNQGREDFKDIRNDVKNMAANIAALLAVAKSNA
jgi:seryl-tRNA synthetase